MFTVNYANRIESSPLRSFETYDEAIAFVNEFLEGYKPFNGEDYGNYCCCQVIDEDRSTEDAPCLVFTSELFWAKDR